MESGGGALSGAEFEVFRRLVRESAGIHLSDAKRALVSARLAKRLRHYGYTSYRQYLEHLAQHDPLRDELQVMVNCITTNKTSFFREPHHFDFLREHVLVPFAGARRHGPAQLRIWSAGCSTGEEPYTIAMTVRSVLPRCTADEVRILASDINTEVLARAARGLYPESALEDAPLDLMAPHLLRGKGPRAGVIRVRPELQPLIAFREINLTGGRWPIRTRFDVIFCRNVIIYFDRETQRALVERFVQYLKPGGFLILGHSENLHGIEHRLTSLRGTIYQLAKG